MIFENRAKGVHLAKNVSYGYIIMAALTALAIMIRPSDFFMATLTFYMAMFIVIYLLATKFYEYKYLWILLIICGIVTILWSLSILGLCLAILLVIAANDIRKGLD